MARENQYNHLHLEPKKETFMLRRTGKFLAEKLKQFIPDAFVFAILLTLVAGLSGFAVCPVSYPWY